jgi:hypothetical protein
VIDAQFNTTDVFIIVKTELVTEKYIRHYERGQRQGLTAHLDDVDRFPFARRVPAAELLLAHARSAAALFPRDDAAHPTGRALDAGRLSPHRLRHPGIKVQVRGKRSDVTPTLFVCNHVSYLDIEVMGSLVPTSFVAKAEVATWPFFSTLAKAQRTIFIERAPARPAPAATRCCDG